MSKTRDQIVTAVRQNLDDEGVGTFYSEDDLNDSIQDGYDEVAVLTECVENAAQVNFQSELTFYDFASLLTGYIRIFAIWNNNTNRWLDPISENELSELRDDWEISNSEPTNYCTESPRYIALFPRPLVASGYMICFYKQQADILIGTSVPQIPVEHDDVLELYATADLLDQTQEYAKAVKYFQEYAARISDIKKAVNSRSLPDRVSALGF